MLNYSVVERIEWEIINDHNIFLIVILDFLMGNVMRFILWLGLGFISALNEC